MNRFRVKLKNIIKLHFWCRHVLYAVKHVIHRWIFLEKMHLSVIVKGFERTLWVRKTRSGERHSPHWYRWRNFRDRILDTNNVLSDPFTISENRYNFPVTFYSTFVSTAPLPWCCDYADVRRTQTLKYRVQTCTNDVQTIGISTDPKFIRKRVMVVMSTAPPPHPPRENWILGQLVMHKRFTLVLTSKCD